MRVVEVGGEGSTSECRGTGGGVFARTRWARGAGGLVEAGEDARAPAGGGPESTAEEVAETALHQALEAGLHGVVAADGAGRG